jgi:ATP-dependent Lon protease
VPKDNEKDIEEISEEIKEGLEIIFVETMEEVTSRALLMQKPGPVK